MDEDDGQSRCAGRCRGTGQRSRHGVGREGFDAARREAALCGPIDGGGAACCPAARPGAAATPLSATPRASAKRRRCAAKRSARLARRRDEVRSRRRSASAPRNRNGPSARTRAGGDSRSVGRAARGSRHAHCEVHLHWRSQARARCASSAATPRGQPPAGREIGAARNKSDSGPAAASSERVMPAETTGGPERAGSQRHGARPRGVAARRSRASQCKRCRTSDATSGGAPARSLERGARDVAGTAARADGGDLRETETGADVSG
jgi:hypothetical protein